MKFEFSPVKSTDNGKIPMFSGHGKLTLRVNDREIWSDEESDSVEGIEDYWDALLDHLAKSWHFLRIEDPYPFFCNPKSPAEFMTEAMQELGRMELGENEFNVEEYKVIAFWERHNLAAAMPDILLSPVFLLREGRDMRIVAENMDVRMEHSQAMAVLEHIGEKIADAVHPNSARGKIILENWQNRNAIPTGAEGYALSIGVSIERLRAIAVNDEELETMFGPISLEEPTRPLIAARMTQHCLDNEEILQVIGRINRIKMEPFFKSFLMLRKKAEKELERILAHEPNIKHYKQGYLLARWLRRKLNIQNDQQVKPKEILAGWGVSVVNTKKLPTTIDAIACWDSEKSGVLVNKTGTHAQKSWGERTTLAHEMAHLLVDTDHAVPHMDILGGKMPALVEKRANAFAAEFLAPRREIQLTIPDKINKTSLEKCMKLLAGQFKVGLVVIGKQIENLWRDEGTLSVERKRLLDRIIKPGSGVLSDYGWLDD